jgi:hypothetical protein
MSAWLASSIQGLQNSADVSWVTGLLASVRPDDHEDSAIGSTIRVMTAPAVDKVEALEPEQCLDHRNADLIGRPSHLFQQLLSSTHGSVPGR